MDILAALLLFGVLVILFAGLKISFAVIATLLKLGLVAIALLMVLAAAPILLLLITPIGAVLLIALNFRTIAYRRSHRISLADGGDKQLLQRMRVHANCAEYAPTGLLSTALAESLAAPGLLLHAIGLTLMAGRTLHAYGMSQSPQVMPLRLGGMVLTFRAIGAASLVAAFLSIQRLAA